MQVEIMHFLWERITPNETVDTRSAATSAASKLGAMGYNLIIQHKPTYSILGGNFESGIKDYKVILFILKWSWFDR